MSKTKAVIMVFMLAATGCATASKGTSGKVDQEEANKDVEKVELRSCLKYNYPEALVSSCFAVAVASPLAVIGGVGYYATSVYRCLTSLDPQLQAKEAQLNQLAEDIKAASAAHFESAKTAIQEVTIKVSTDERARLQELYNVIQSRIESLSEAEYKKLEKLSGKLLYDFYEQVSAVKEGKFERVEP